MVHAFRKHGERYIVSQTFTAGIDTGIYEKDLLMFSQYSNIGHARDHFNAVRPDKYAAIIDLENAKHRSRIAEMLGAGSRYLVFSKLISDRDSMKATATKLYADRLRRYIARNTTWRIPSNGHLFPDIQLVFGELIIVLKFRSQQIRLKFQDLENQ